MTTIAYRSGVLAADTLIAYNTITNGERDKIERCGDYLVAMAGVTWVRPILEEWVRAGCDPNEVPEQLLDNQDKFAALIVAPNGLAHEFDSGYLVPVHADYTAIGSGALIAMGAMAHGATAEEAVMAASRHDKATGGPVTAHKVEGLPCT